MSLLRQNGHPFAAGYPIGEVWNEEHLILRSKERDLAREALLMNMAILAAFSKDASTDFNNQIRTMLNDPA